MEGGMAPKKTPDIVALREKAALFRREILETLCEARSGHPGGSLSCVEILTSLYFHTLRHQPRNPRWEGRDRLIISKGHASPAVYVVLANCGYFPKDELKTFRKVGSRLQGHVSTEAPGVEFNTGSLGHGLSVANGMAIGARMRKNNCRIYCIMGDGELQEGSVWEAAMSAAHHGLDAVCAIVDYNKVQENGPTNDIKNLEPLKAKWESFGWHACEVDGHDFTELMNALDTAELIKEKPSVIIAHTIKGKGVSFMEGKAAWHGKAPNQEQLQQALKEIGIQGR